VSLLRILFDLVAPPRKSERLVRGLNVDTLHVLASPTSGALPYHDPRVTALVWEVKYRGNAQAAALAGEFLAEQLLALAGEELGKPLLVPVPMHPARRQKRGHNQTELLCKALMSYASDAADYAPEALARVKETAPQQGLERHKRLHNVRGSMEAQDFVNGRVCIVIDDVTTTGATLDEARRALLKAGARRVHYLTLAAS
jgi:ComF family protein